MDIRAMAMIYRDTPNTYKRVLICKIRATMIFLLLIVLLPLNAASSENDLIWLTNDLSACVSKVDIAKNIVVRHFAKQEAWVTGHYKGYLLLKLTLLHGEARLSWPYCGRSRIWVGGTPGEHGIFCFVQSPTQRASIDNDAVMWCSSWGEPVVLEVVTEDGVGSNCGIAWVAVDILACQPKAIKNRTDVGAELPMFGIDGRVGLYAGGFGEPSSISRPDNTSRNSYT
jgi:hypothetical protein